MNRFIRNILITDALLIVIGVLPLYIFVSESDALAAIAAILFTSAYTLAGTMLTNRFFYAGHKEFMSNVFGTVAARLLALAAAIFVTLKYTSLPEITFTVSIFISYIGKSIQEILFIHRKSAQT